MVGEATSATARVWAPTAFSVNETLTTPAAPALNEKSDGRPEVPAVSVMWTLPR